MSDTTETTAAPLEADGLAADASAVDEGDIAADYLEELLDLADLDGDIEIATRSGRVYLTIEAEEPDALRLLSKPDTVGALQELTRLAVHAKTGEFSRLILDIAGSRDARA